MAIAATTMKQDDLQSLLERVRPMIAGIDLASEMSERVESAIAFGELGGSVADDEFKKLMILWDRGDISGDELDQLIVAGLVDERRTEASIKNVIGTMAIEGFELDDEDIARCRSILEGKENGDDVVAELVARYRAIAKSDTQKKRPAR